MSPKCHIVYIMTHYTNNRTANLSSFFPDWGSNTRPPISHAYAINGRARLYLWVEKQHPDTLMAFSYIMHTDGLDPYGVHHTILSQFDVKRSFVFISILHWIGTFSLIDLIKDSSTIWRSGSQIIEETSTISTTDSIASIIIYVRL